MENDDSEFKKATMLIAGKIVDKWIAEMSAAKTEEEMDEICRKYNHWINRMVISRIN